MTSLKISYLIQHTEKMFKQHGVRSHIACILEGLDKRGHQVSLYGLKGRSIVGGEFIDQVNTCDINGIFTNNLYTFLESGIRRVQQNLAVPHLGFFDGLRFYDACRQIVGGSHLLHERQGHFSIGGSLTSKRLKIPLVLEVNADPLRELKYIPHSISPLQKIVIKWMAKVNFDTAAAIFCVSNVTKKDLVDNWEIHPDKITVIPNAANISDFSFDQDSHQAPGELGLSGHPSIIFVGSFRPWHDLSFLLECFSGVIEVLPRTRLILVGDGPTRDDIVKISIEKGIRENLIFMGEIDHNKIPSVLHECDIAVAPYPKFKAGYWQSPIKLFEYMAAGKAIVASSVGQIADVIHDYHDGLLVEPEDSYGFTKAILYLLENPSERRRLGKNAKRKIETEYSWSKYAERLETLYLNVINEI